MDNDDLWREYQEIGQNIRWLGEVRFKLLTLVPSVSGLAVALLAQVEVTSAGAALAISLLGLVATVGVFVYDLRNSEIYNALLFRARDLERRLDLSSSGLRPGFVGQYGERPLPRGEGTLLAVTHGLGLALMYGAAFGLWTFAVTHFVIIAAGVPFSNQWAAVVGFVVAAGVVMSLLITRPTRSPTTASSKSSQQGPGQ